MISGEKPHVLMSMILKYILVWLFFIESKENFTCLKQRSCLHYVKYNYHSD